jgi:hypothetical protein
MQSLAWLTTQAVALRPVWTMLHAGLLAWGLMLLVLARQPVWVDNAGRALWARVQPLAHARRRPAGHRRAVGADALWPAVFGAAGGRPERRCGCRAR